MNAQAQTRVRRPAPAGRLARAWRAEKERDRAELLQEFREHPELAERELEDWGQHVVEVDLRSIQPLS